MVTMVRDGAGKQGGLAVGDKITGIGDVAFKATAWAEKSDYERALSSPHRPLLITYKSSLNPFPRAGAAEQAAAKAALGRVSAFFTVAPYREADLINYFTRERAGLLSASSASLSGGLAVSGAAGGGSMTVDELVRVLCEYGAIVDPTDAASLRATLGTAGIITRNEFFNVYIHRAL